MHTWGVFDCSLLEVSPGAFILAHAKQHAKKTHKCVRCLGGLRKVSPAYAIAFVTCSVARVCCASPATEPHALHCSTRVMLAPRRCSSTASWSNTASCGYSTYSVAGHQHRHTENRRGQHAFAGCRVPRCARPSGVPV